MFSFFPFLIGNGKILLKKGKREQKLQQQSTAKDEAIRALYPKSKQQANN